MKQLKFTELPWVSMSWLAKVHKGNRWQKWDGTLGLWLFQFGTKRKLLDEVKTLLRVGKEMAAHSSVPAWRIPGTGEPGGLPPMGSHTIGHDWSDLAAAAAARVGQQEEFKRLQGEAAVEGSGRIWKKWVFLSVEEIRQAPLFPYCSYSVKGHCRTLELRVLWLLSRSQRAWQEVLSGC